MYSIETDLKEAEAMAKSLVPYVYQDNLYGSSGGGGFLSNNKTPALTIGALLLRLRRLEAMRDDMTDGERARLDRVQEQNQAVLTEWRAHYEGKLLREAKSRLDAMKHFFEECSEDPRLCANAYKPEASRRTIVQEILMAMADLNMEQDEDLQKKLRAADGGLRRYIQPDDFLWDAELEPVYPKADFWWLYSRPPLPSK